MAGMKPTRRTQPYRKSGSRPPSLTLEKMLAGGRQGVKPGAGRVLSQAMSKPASKSKRTLPRY